MQTSCTCNSGKLARKCCDRFLVDGQQPRTPEQLMRSRYSAYARGGHGRYLLSTWFPATAQGLSEASLSESSVKWTGLEVIDRMQQGDKGVVEFRAHYLDEQGRPKTLHERSVFQRIARHWFYVGGEVS